MERVLVLLKGYSIKIVVVFVGMFILINLYGCAGLGFNKQCTVMPDEFSISGDYNLVDNQVSEVTGGFKWRFQ